MVVPPATRRFNVIRIAFEFTPMVGGSVTNLVKLSGKINPYLRSQLIIAPQFGEECFSSDTSSNTRIIRVKYPNALRTFAKVGLPIRPLVLLGYSIEVWNRVKTMAKELGENTIIQVHGTLLGAMLSVLSGFSRTDIPIMITQDSANPFRVSLKEALATGLAIMLFKIRKPDLLMIVDDGMGIKTYGHLLDRMGVKWTAVNHAIEIPVQVDTANRKRDGFVVLSTSRLVKFKRVDLTVLGFAEFYKCVSSNEGACLVVLGDGPELDRLLQIVHEQGLEGTVKFKGQKSHEEVMEALSRSDVVVGTSLISNLNLSIQEAMAAGRAVVVFDSEEMKALIKHLENGILVENGNIKALAAALELLYRNQSLRRSLGSKARNTIALHRSWDARIRSELDSYESLLTMI